MTAPLSKDALDVLCEEARKVLRKPAAFVSDGLSIELGMAAGLADAIDALQLALSTSEARNAWQPIETAPRDGTTIILWNGNSGLKDRVVVGAYDEDSVHPWRFLNNPFPLTRYGHDKDSTTGGMGNSFLSEPTHWMPMPPAPSDQQETPK